MSDDKSVGSIEVLERMQISEQENTALIYASTRDRVVQCGFGRHFELLPLESNRWAFDLVRKMRAKVSHESKKEATL